MDQDSCLVKLINLFVSYEDLYETINRGFFIEIEKLLCLDTVFPNLCFNGYFDLVKIIVEKGGADLAELNVALIKTVKGGRLDIVKFLLQKGANLLNKPLSIAAENGRLDIVEVLLDKGANGLNDALIEASCEGHLDIVKYLADKGAYNWEEALYWAKFGNHSDVIDFLQRY